MGGDEMLPVVGYETEYFFFRAGSFGGYTGFPILETLTLSVTRLLPVSLNRS